MIEPNMATSAARIPDNGRKRIKLLSSRVLEQAVNCLFNRITIDGDMSTNDSVLFPQMEIRVKLEKELLRYESFHPWSKRFAPAWPGSA